MLQNAIQDAGLDKQPELYQKLSQVYNYMCLILLCMCPILYRKLSQVYYYICVSYH
jgi:hypothetical protein